MKVGECSVLELDGGFTKVACYGAIVPAYLLQHKKIALSLGWLMASECLAHGIDLSFAPVLDLDRGSDVVGDRAFSSDISKDGMS